ncbi:MAG: T9SS type A sorting domain-containing protein [Ignavibacteriae bacterium]|nr:T9SS type A sorting domain-containing protein [Ignavibacteriota bacterium]
MKKIIFKLLILTSVFTILNSSFLTDCFAQSGWFYQPLPVSGQIRDFRFIDENIGLVAMTGPLYLLRTTNGGYNWQTVLSGQYISQFDIIDNICVYARGGNSNAYGMIYRSYDCGATWDSLLVANSWTVNGISFVNRDTGWVGGSAGGLPFLWRTTNRGVNWTVQSDNTGRGKVFFLKNKVNGEYIGWSQDDEVIWKTTNSGLIWFQISNIGLSSQLYFIDENTGFAATNNSMKKTTNGGLNWETYYMPTAYNIFENYISTFKIINKDTIYGVGATRYWTNPLRTRGIVWVSTNGGVNWGFQQPDTAFQRSKYNGIDFINKDTGFCDFIRTNGGGGPIIFTEINTNITEMPGVFRLEQNYPNPFNSSTRIDFSVSVPSSVTIIVSDITGKDILRIFDNEHFNAGNYYAAIDISKMNLASGVYMYRMIVTDAKQNNVFLKSRKFVYMK